MGFLTIFDSKNTQKKATPSFATPAFATVFFGPHVCHFIIFPSLASRSVIIRPHAYEYTNSRKCQFERSKKSRPFLRIFLILDIFLTKKNAHYHRENDF